MVRPSDARVFPSRDDRGMLRLDRTRRTAAAVRDIHLLMVGHVAAVDVDTANRPLTIIGFSASKRNPDFAMTRVTLCKNVQN